MSIQPEAFLPVLAATGTAEGFTVPGQVFDIREMVLIEVEVDRAGILAVRAAKQGGCNVGCVFFIFIFPVVMSGRETVYLNIDFVHFF